ncbi:MAG: NnrS family protein [Rubrivivax sp.]
MKPLLHLEEPAPLPARRFALFDLGFRPFYLLASVFAALSIPLWALQFSGWLQQPYLAGPLWHAHEMLFGFTLAVIVGFLFTAGRNWTNQPTPTGWPLAALAALWLAARLLVLTPFAVAAAAANIAFPLAAALALAVPFVKARNRRNYFFVGLLALLALASAVIHLSQLGWLALPPGRGVQVALDVVLFILSVMGGRVIPMFTNNGVPGAAASRRPWVEKAALGSVLALVVLDALGLDGAPLAVVAALAAAAHAARWALWQPWKTLRVPLVWVLHLAYLWVPLHLGLRVAGVLGWAAPSLAVHALTVGAVGGMIIGMMTRTARGHTARPLRADGYEVACYVLVALAALVRVGLPLLAPAELVHAALVSAALWSAGFGLYAVRYWPILSRPRLDGRPG